jgi:hypothetical protein
MDGHDGVAGVVLVAEQGPELALFEALLEPVDRRCDLGLDAFALRGELPEDLELLLGLSEELGELKVLFEPLLLLLEGLGGLLVLPDLRGGQAGVEGIPFGLLASEVKESPGPLRASRRVRRGGL